MKLRVLVDAAEVTRVGAGILARAAAARPRLTLGLPTGRTVVGFYAELARAFQAGELDLSGAASVNLDELMIPPDHPASFYRFMSRHAWERIGLDRTRCSIPSGVVEPAEECRRYDALLEGLGPLDLVVLGVGEDGHVAYNLPGPAHESTHVVALPSTLAERLEVADAWRPLRAITVGLRPMREARQLLLMATGRAKAAAVRALVEGPQTSDWPCTLLGEHPRFDVLVDREAACELASDSPAVEGDPS